MILLRHGPPYGSLLQHRASAPEGVNGQVPRSGTDGPTASDSAPPATMPLPVAGSSGAETGTDLAPRLLNHVWIALIVLTILEASRELFGLAGPKQVYESVFPDLVIGASAALILVRAARDPKARRAWLAMGLAMASWCLGNTIWSVLYGAAPRAPYPTVADVFWLLWYPLMAVGLFHLIRLSVPRFTLHRWMDGLAVAFVGLALGSILVIEPATHHTAEGLFATLVGLSYPALDVVMIGAILGVYGLLDWRPDRVWVLLGLGTLATTVVDTTFAVNQARGVAQGGHDAFVWTLGAVLIGYASWVRRPETSNNLEHIVGLGAVALPLVAQGLAAGVQIYAYFKPVDRIERLITVAVLAVSCAQIIITRPRPATRASHADADHGHDP